MPWILVIVGLFATLIGFANASFVTTTSAIQQTVQRLDVVTGLLGLVVFGLGLVIMRLQGLYRVLASASVSKKEDRREAAE